jgi:hypothetical protein
MLKLTLEIPETASYVEPVYTTGYPCDVSFQQNTPTSDSDSLPEFMPIENDWIDHVSYGFDHDAFFREDNLISDVSYNIQGEPTTPPGHRSPASKPPVLVRKNRFRAVEAAVANGRVSVRPFPPIEAAIQSGHVQTRERPENPHIRALEESQNITTRANAEDANVEALEMAIEKGHVGVRR